MGLRFGSYPSTKLKNIELDFVFGSRFRLKLLTTESSTERTRNFVAVIALDSVFQQAASSVELILKKNSAIIETISLSWPGLSIVFHRGGNYQPQDKSGVYDEIVLRQNQSQAKPEAEAIIEVVATINKKLKAFDAKRAATNSADEERAHLEALHNSSIERL